MAKAYVNKRDKFLWDNSFKPEMSIPVPEVSDVGKAVVVDADGDYTLGDVSVEDEIVYVHFVEATSTLVDYTFAELKALLDAGKHVVLVRDNADVRAYYELYSYYDNEAIFTNQRTLEYLNEDTLFAYNVTINFTNQTLVQYLSRHVLSHKIYDTAIAYEYETARNYSVGDYCIYNSRLYRCINATTGTFDGDDWTMTHVMREIPRIQHNYSNTERVVGTWIDGKTLYEKTWHFDTDVYLQANATTSLEPNGVIITNGDLIVDAKLVSETDKRVFNAFYVGYTLGEIGVKNTSSAMSITAITLQYTKTTD